MVVVADEVEVVVVVVVVPGVFAAKAEVTTNTPDTDKIPVVMAVIMIRFALFLYCSGLKYPFIWITPLF